MNRKSFIKRMLAGMATIMVIPVTLSSAVSKTKSIDGLTQIKIRQLLLEIKKYVQSASERLLFEQNTAETRKWLKYNIESHINYLQEREKLLYKYDVIIDETNNPPDIIDTNQLVGYVQITPFEPIKHELIFNIDFKHK